MNGRLLETFCDKAVDCVVCDIELPFVLPPGVYLVGIQTKSGRVVENLHGNEKRTPNFSGFFI